MRESGAKPVGEATLLGDIAVANNLPRWRTRLFGRNGDLKGIAGLLAGSGMVTITGPPGMGKTRLAVAVASARVEEFPAGVWLVQLAPVGNSGLVAQTVASVMSVDYRPASGGDPYAPIIDRIGSGPLLLVLDNCEHLLDGCAELVAALLDKCPNLAILATSQERLSIVGERVWPLPGLALAPDTDPEPEPEPNPDLEPDARVDAAEPGPAVQLFEERARAGDPSFSITPESVLDVVEICRRLDGIPLAIELAAARANTFPPAEIARRLDDRFTFLTGGSRAVLPRHQTLRAAVDWSYDLLDAAEQALLRRLSVFAGGVTVEAVEEVCAGDGLDADACAALVGRLVSRSLVVADTTTTADARFHLLETIRFYGRERLVAAGEVTAVAARHVRWCVGLAEATSAGASGGEERARVERELDNLRVAMAWSLDQGPTEDALRIAAALAVFWRVTSRFREGLDWLARTLAANEAAPSHLRSKGLWGQALLAAMCGDAFVAGPASRAALDLYEDAGDAAGIARSLLVIASLPDRERPPGDDVVLLQRAIALARQVDDAWCLAQAMVLCGSTFQELGDPDAARPVLEEAVAVARQAGDGQCLAFALVALGRVALSQGELDRCTALLEEALAVTGQGRSTYETGFALIGLGLVAAIRGDHDRADELLGAAVVQANQMASTVLAVDVAHAAGDSALGNGDLDSAEAWFRRSAELAESTGDGSRSLVAARGLGDVAVARGDVAAAADHLALAVDLAQWSGQRSLVADALDSLGRLARLEGDDVRAATSHHEALRLRIEIGDRVGKAASLESIGGVLAGTGRADRAARAFGAAHALRQAGGYARSRILEPQHDADVALAREALDPEAFEAAWADGASMTPAAAATYLSKGRGARSRPSTGVAALTDAERQVFDLTVARLTNAEIAERLFISVNTVKSHLNKVYAKLFVSSRKDLLSHYSDSHP